MQLTLVIITLNEEINLARCLESAKTVADEIVIVDSFSTDGTGEIALSFGARFIQRSWMGFAQTKNYANGLASHDWILSLDADEVLDEAMSRHILRIKEQSKPDHQAYELRRLPNYCGHWIRHSGWNPDRKIRLFNRKTARWVGDYVHESLQVDAGLRIGHLEGICYHYTFRTIQEHVATINRYSELAKDELKQRGKKATLFHLIIKPWAEFIRSYILKGGFRDGYAGLIVSMMNAYDKFIRYAKLYMER
jgi:glycosyltransferase involved in cell wall biosynthesis